MTRDASDAIQTLCITRGWTLCLAESCTGGHLAASLTCLPGCSAYFLGSIVAYSNALKTKLLGVDSHLLQVHGAVSGPVVGQMAQGALSLSGSDFSLAVSGIAGPGGGSSQKPVGTIWAAIGSKGLEPFIWDFYLTGNRQEIIDKSVDSILFRFLTVIKAR